jgi:2-dehydropantoate 2-reductase
LPTPLLRLVARGQIKIDPEARSSMWDDISKGRITEVEDLNGEIVRLALTCRVDAPLNRRVVEIVQQAEKAHAGSPKLSADALWRAITRP